MKNVESGKVSCRVSASMMMAFRSVEEKIVPFMCPFFPVTVNEASISVSPIGKGQAESDGDIRVVSRLKIIKGKTRGHIRPLRFISMDVVFVLSRLDYRWVFSIPLHITVTVRGLRSIKLTCSEVGSIMPLTPADRNSVDAVQGFIAGTLG